MTLAELVELQKKEFSWTIVSPKIVNGFVLCANASKGEKAFSQKWLTDKVADGTIILNTDGSFNFKKTAMPEPKDFK